MLITKADPQRAYSFDTNDGSAWREFQSGNKTAYSFIYQKYAGNLYNYGMQVVRNKDLVEDVIQDLFVGLWRRRRNITPVRSVKFYLLTCLRRAIVKEIQKANRFTSDDIAWNQMSFQFNPSIEDDIIEAQTSLERKTKLHGILLSLSARQREIIYLKFYENLSYPQIAENLGLDIKYTYNVASRAFCLIKKHFSALCYCSLFLSIN
jgi:RNA polymerase sigma factor (sigma-70 family)